MFSFLKAAASTAEETIVRGFDSIKDRLAVIGKHLLEAIEHPFTPPGLKVALPMLLDLIEDLRQEVAELRQPCPCKPAPTSTTDPAGDAVPGAAAAPTDQAGDAGLPEPSVSMAVDTAAKTVTIDGQEITEADFASFIDWLKERQAAKLTGQTGA